MMSSLSVTVSAAQPLAGIMLQCSIERIIGKTREDASFLLHCNNLLQFSHIQAQTAPRLAQQNQRRPYYSQT